MITVQTLGGDIEAVALPTIDGYPSIDVSINGELAVIVEFIEFEGRFVIHTYAKGDEEPRNSFYFDTGKEKGV